MPIKCIQLHEYFNKGFLPHCYRAKQDSTAYDETYYSTAVALIIVAGWTVVIAADYNGNMSKPDSSLVCLDLLKNVKIRLQ